MTRYVAPEPVPVAEIENALNKANKVAIDAGRLHIVSDHDARALFKRYLGAGEEWASQLMAYRTTAAWQDDWVVEVGNWLARAKSLGFLDQIVRALAIEKRQQVTGLREANDPVHRGVHQALLHAMAVHYFVGTGWQLHAVEPHVTDLRRDGTRADVDLQLISPNGIVVDVQAKASGTLGVHDNEADRQIREGINYGMEQLPDPPLGPSFVLVGAQRGWPSRMIRTCSRILLGRPASTRTIA